MGRGGGDLSDGMKVQMYKDFLWVAGYEKEKCAFCTLNPCIWMRIPERGLSFDIPTVPQQPSRENHVARRMLFRNFYVTLNNMGFFSLQVKTNF